MLIGEIFAGFGALRPVDRFQIAAVVHDSRRCWPVTSPDFEALPVPPPGSARDLFLHRLGDALIQVVDTGLASATLGALVPGIVALGGGIETAPGATTRLVALARANGHRTWAELAGCAIGEIRSWHGAGQLMTVRLVVVATSAALRAGTPAERDRQPTLWSSDVTDPTERSGGGGGSPSSAQGDTASDIHLDPVGALLGSFLADLNDLRSRFVFELDELRVDLDLDLDLDRARGDRPATHEFIGVGAERARQLRLAARQQIMTAFRRHAAAEQRIAALAAVLGQAADRRGLDVALESLGLPDTSDPVGLLALWLAGPYRSVPRHAGWWSPDASKLVRETEAVVSMGGGVHPYEVLIKDLIGIGVTEEHAAGWLARQRVRIEHGVVVDLRGRVRDIAERALEATGRSMTQGELCSWLPIEVPDLALVNELRKNPRFIETGPGRWELADWGGEPSAHLVRVAVPVTPEVMAGDQAALAGDLACLLGLPANDPVILVTRFGPMTVTYDGARVMRGTARPVALASGAAIGDVLWFVIDPRDLAAEVTIESADPAG